ncbi:MAG: PAT family beta-lactamase induction signal transducer AmpG [Alteromonadaceae bacterium]|jgi:PAT family beta-lactamase induction signal transducer AmpG
MASQRTLGDYLRNFNDRRLIAVFLFGIASGFPWVMIGSAMSAWLKEEGLSRSSIGYFGLVFAVYSINFLWSPLIDRLKLPLINALLGQRRSWILLMQIGIIGGCCLLATMDPGSGLAMAGLAALIISISSATQDIAIDAYRIDIIPAREHEKISAGAAMATSGWWTGYAGLGSIAFFLADRDGWDWSSVYFLLALIMSFFIIVVLVVEEPPSERDELQHKLEAQYQQKLGGFAPQHYATRLKKVAIWLTVTLIEPIKEFFDRNGVKLALSLLLFILLFKIGEAFLGRMSIVFYKEVGFSNSEIAIYSKLVSWWVTIAFSLIGSLFIMRFGIVKGLFIGGLAMSASNLMFALMAIAGPNQMLFLATVIVDGYTSAWSSVAFVAFISMLCNRSFTASQYALLASLSTLGRTLIGSSSGALVDYLNGNWSLFFILTTLMVIPSLIILYFLKDRLNDIENSHKSSQDEI